jgi:hypothetical protein
VTCNCIVCGRFMRRVARLALWSCRCGEAYAWQTSREAARSWARAMSALLEVT